MKRYFSIACLLLAFLVAKAGVVDTLLIHSEVMNKEIKCVLILPDNYQSSPDKKYPVLYLLHGYSSNQKSWIKGAPRIAQLSDEAQMIIICPYAGNSWYWNSPIKPESKYETFMTKELVGYMDQHFRTMASREGRAVTGLSMGGQGGMWLSIRHKEIYGAGGSLSGGLDIRKFPNKWELNDLLGDPATSSANWEEYAIINHLDSLKNGELSLIIDCGVDDFFFEVNNKFHEELLKRKINHDYILSNGAHNWEYWRRAIEYQVVFFKRFFDKSR